MTGAAVGEPQLTGQKVLVTGGLGFLGSNLSRRLAELGADVRIADASIPDSGCNPYNLSGFEARVRIETADIRDSAGMTRLLADRDIVFHLAAQVSHGESMRDPLTDLDQNCRGTLTLLEACRAVRPGIRIVFAGTRQVYGRVESIPVSEDQPPAPVDINGIHKLAAERYLDLYRRIHGLASVSLRLTNVYGPRMRIRDAHNNFLGWWIRQALEGHPIPVFGDGMRRRDFLFVDDAVRALIAAAALPDNHCGIYNLGGLEPLRLIDLARLLVEVHGGGGIELTPFPPERQSIDIGDYAGDYSKFRAASGWAPTVPLRDGLARTFAFYEEHGPHYR